MTAPLRGAAVLALLLTFTALAPVLSGFVATSVPHATPSHSRRTGGPSLR